MDSLARQQPRYHPSPHPHPPNPPLVSALSQTLFVLHSFLLFLILPILLSSLSVSAFSVSFRPPHTSIPTQLSSPYCPSYLHFRLPLLRCDVLRSEGDFLHFFPPLLLLPSNTRSSLPPLFVFPNHSVHQTSRLSHIPFINQRLLCF